MILVTTAGKVGAEASRLLGQRGAPVRVLVRNPEKVTALEQAGVDVCRGDLEAPAMLDVGLSENVAEDNARAVALMAEGADAAARWLPV